ncbi:NAD-dependent protein deacylase [Paratractidigestivibacter faecalis]|uniref:NAD-dependent protein deacylase n=1 Tax=Paratractidigestivibacter faecalis TaxID=2292441 RepID=UPI00388FC251
MAKVISDAAQAAAELSAAVDQATSMVFFGGAGVSTASGIPDFRSEDGLYHQHFKYPPEEMLSHDFYVTHTEEFFDFYRTRMIALGAKPSQAHLKLAELERAGKLAAVVTQNIDGLHQAAGSKNVLELHGSVHRNVCQRCGRVYSAEWIMGTEGAPRCPECGGAIKPDVVLYGESLDERVLTASVDAISKADLLVIGGTSLVVYPAAGLVNYFNGSRLVIVNRQSTPQDASADLVCACDIAKAFDF